MAKMGHVALTLWFRLQPLCDGLEYAKTLIFWTNISNKSGMIVAKLLPKFLPFAGRQLFGYRLSCKGSSRALHC